MAGQWENTRKGTRIPDLRRLKVLLVLVGE
jgi:hypothetical protein